jgi:hypothetical protein
MRLDNKPSFVREEMDDSHLYWEAYYNVKSKNAVSWIYFFNVTNIFVM